jgi:hypothetical protein
MNNCITTYKWERVAGVDWEYMRLRRGSSNLFDTRRLATVSPILKTTNWRIHWIRSLAPVSQVFTLEEAKSYVESVFALEEE